VDIKPIAGAAAAGLACAEILTMLYKNESDLELIERSRTSFEQIVFTQYGTGIPFMNGTEPWPMIVADTVFADRSNDGAGDPDSAPLLCLILLLVSTAHMSRDDSFQLLEPAILHVLGTKGRIK
jgi:hypothetical protein